jgi:hypothetical protein
MDELQAGSSSPREAGGLASDVAEPADPASPVRLATQRRSLSVVPTGWASIDRLFGGGLPCHGVHEWIGLIRAAQRSLSPAQRAGSGTGSETSWLAPLAVLIHLAHQGVRCIGPPAWQAAARSVLWIGRSVWPNARCLVAGMRSPWECREAEFARPCRITDCSRRVPDTSLLDCSLFIDVPPEPSVRHRPRSHGRLWAIEQAIRCEGVSVIVADASGLDMAASRRLQLAAAARSSPQLILLARPPWEAATLSAAITRWIVTTGAVGERLPQRMGSQAAASAQRMEAAPGEAAPGETAPEWLVRLVRCKSSLMGSLSPTARLTVAGAVAAATPSLRELHGVGLEAMVDDPACHESTAVARTAWEWQVAGATTSHHPPWVHAGPSGGWSSIR